MEREAERVQRAQLADMPTALLIDELMRREAAARIVYVGEGGAQWYACWPVERGEPLPFEVGRDE